MQDHTFIELKSVGRKYTWTNDHVHNKIDRAIVNVEWMHVYSHIKAIIMDPRCSLRSHSYSYTFGLESGRA